MYYFILESRIVDYWMPHADDDNGSDNENAWQGGEQTFLP